MTLTPEQVRSIVDAFVASVKPYYNDGEIKRGGARGIKRASTPWPEYWPGYNEAVRQRDELRVHIESGVYPEHLFRARAPHQTEEEYQYSKANFKQTTLGDYADFENTILRALHESNWRLDRGDRAGDVDDELSWTHYVSKRIEHFGSVAEYFKHIIPKIKTLDPMGVICVMPERLPTVERSGDDGTTIVVIDPDTLVDPQPIYFEVQNVVGKNDGNWYLLMRRETSIVQKANKDVNEGMVLWLVDAENCYRVYQTGKAHELNFGIDLYFAHETGFVPVEPLKGRPVLKDGAVVHESFYMPAKDLLDLVLLDSANLTAVKAACVWPQRVMYGNECEFTDARLGGSCRKGTWYLPSEEGVLMPSGECPSCKGSGLSVSLGPNKVLLIKAPSARDGVDAPKVQDAMTYVEPSSSTTDTLAKEIEANRTAARRQLHLYSEQPMAGGDAPSATQVGVGVKAQNAFIAPIASQIFGTMDFVLKTVTIQRYGDAEGYYDLIPATQYDLRTEADYIAMLGEAQDKGLPPSAIEEVLRGFFAARYGSDPYMAEAFQVIATADTLLTVNWQQLQAMQGKNQVQAWEVLLHNRALTLYDELMRDPGFRGMEPFEKAEALQLKAQEEAGTTAPAQAVNETPAQRALRLVQQTEEGDDTAMINGVIDILRGIADMDNRQRSAEERLAQFASEGVTVDRADFLARVMA